MLDAKTTILLEVLRDIDQPPMLPRHVYRD